MAQRNALVIEAGHQTFADLVTADLPTFTIRTAAGVPSGAPTGAELPIAYNTTAVTGGFYYWNGSVWVKVATIL